MTSDRPHPPTRPIVLPVAGAGTPSLPARFYKSVTVAESADGKGFGVLLDGRTVKTPARRNLEVPGRGLAQALAAEWSGQQAVIDPAAMPLTRLVNTALDGVASRTTEVAADIVKYAGSDLVCYRADFPEGLVARQIELWDPVLAWLARRFGSELRVQCGLMHVAQPQAALDAFAAVVAPLDAFSLTALHVMTTLMGSAVLALAVLEGELSPEAAWDAAHVDEDWQITEWGADAEAMARREFRWKEMQAAAKLVRLAVRAVTLDEA